MTDGPIIADGYAWHELDIDGTGRWSAAAYSQCAASEHGLLPVGSLAVVVADVLNLTAASGLDASAVATLDFQAIAAVFDGHGRR